ncbi:LPXTG cell wall anchor domain-containing protein [Kitasatospora azatica]|uniref:LPXTG cell wall anchor domain-containing protein n=1 Tax=Kitasatospora azatica TaxID=58347 RepID=UPI00056C928B|nr:LPXTG cell wall anchor domain-containing protein [Kitasatospora azatica]
MRARITSLLISGLASAALVLAGSSTAHAATVTEQSAESQPLAFQSGWLDSFLQLAAEGSGPAAEDQLADQGQSADQGQATDLIRPGMRVDSDSDRSSEFALPQEFTDSAAQPAEVAAPTGGFGAPGQSLFGGLPMVQPQDVPQTLVQGTSGEHGGKPGKEHGEHGTKPGEHGAKPGPSQGQGQGQGQKDDQGQQQGQGQKDDQGQQQGQGQKDDQGQQQGQGQKDDQGQQQDQGQAQDVSITVIVENKQDNKQEVKQDNKQEAKQEQDNKQAQDNKQDNKNINKIGVSEESLAPHAAKPGHHPAPPQAAAHPEKGELAHTGADVQTLIPVTAALIMAGGAMVLFTRRRRA